MATTELTMAEQADSASGDAGAQQEAFIGRLFEAGLGMLELCSLYLGDRLGLYGTLHRMGPSTYESVAAEAGIAPRYAREWLEQQAVAGIVTVDDAAADSDRRRYALPDWLVPILLEPENPMYLAFLARFMTIGGALPALVKAYRSGEGISWAALGEDAREAQEEQNRPVFVNDLPGWLASIPEVDARLRAGGRVADVCSGGGWLGISVARAYPTVTVDGFDADDASVASARRNAAEAGVANRVRFEVADVAEQQPVGPYDLAIVFEALHDLARPVEALSRIRASLAPGGTVLIVDERVDEAFSAPSEDPMQRFFYAASLVVCLPNSMAEQPSAATGTVMRPSTLQVYAREAGFADIEILPIEHPFFRVYRLIG
jgi:2-polyprenyl-3-methyl-5-hydroxy-6-metoxy-1,4-benzoquinol methylase